MHFPSWGPVVAAVGCSVDNLLTLKGFGPFSRARAAVSWTGRKAIKVEGPGSHHRPGHSGQERGIMGRPVIGGVTELTAADLVRELRGGAASDRTHDRGSSTSSSDLALRDNLPPSFPNEAARLHDRANEPAEALPAGRNPGDGIEKLRTLHHRIARVLAGFEGKVAPAAAVLGIDPGRIRNLQHNPAFVELVAFYRDRGDEVILDLKARMELLAHDSLSELHERLIGEPETSLTNQEIINLTERLLDRLGHAPVQKGVVANVTLTGDEMRDLFQGANRVRVLENVREATEAVPSALPGAMIVDGSE